MVKMLTKGSVLHTPRELRAAGSIHTSIGFILVAVNPCRYMLDLHAESVMEA
jgi:myosin heavy subunit